jgi:small-conductance mechanosensitive channel
MEESHINVPSIPEEPKGLLLLLPEAQEFLLETGKWAKFLGIVGYILAGLIVLAGLFFTAFMSAVPHIPTATPMPKFLSSSLGFIYILLGVFHFFIARYLHQFGTRVIEGITYNNAETVSTSLGKLKSLFKLVGIATIIIISLYILVFIGVIIAAIIGFSMVRPG